MMRFFILLLFVLALSTPALAQFDMQQIVVMQGARDSLQFGRVLAGVGDINKDGFEDLVIGQRAKTFLYFGSKSFDTIPDLTFSFWTFHVSHGDINGDSISDLLLGTFGKIYIYCGSVSFDTIPDDSVVNSAQGFGTNFACGDINKDGYDDIAVYGDYTKVFVYLGGDTISKQPACVLQGPPNYFGLNGLAIGDVNGDGYGDLAISTNPPAPLPESTYIYFGGVGLDTVPRIKFNGGYSVLGDLNGDGYADVVTSRGTYFGGAIIDSVIDSPFHTMGSSWIISNFNKDKYEDLLWGTNTLAGGEAGIYLGGNPLDTIEDWHYYDSEVGDYGLQVGVADINGDGVDEAIVGDPGWWYNNPSFPPGRVYIYKNPYTAVKDEEQLLPFTFTLGQNYPNPFNSGTVIKYALPEESEVKIVVYNLLGQKVRVLVEDVQEPGYYTISWDGKNEQGSAVGSGIYFYRIQAGSFTKTAKMSLLK